MLSPRHAKTEGAGRRLCHRRERWLAGGVALAALLAVLFWRPIQSGVTAFLTPRLDQPSLRRRGAKGGEPQTPEYLMRLWHSRSLAARQSVFDYLQERGRSDPALWQAMESTVLEAARDVDVGVRERALALLAARKHPELERLAREQLADVDPVVRALGLKRLPQARPEPIALGRERSLPLPDFTFDDLSGQKVLLSGFRGRTLLVSFWDLTNRLGAAEFAGLQGLQARHGQSLAVVGVCLLPPVGGDCCARGHESGETNHEDHLMAAKALNRARLLELVAQEKITLPVLVDSRQESRATGVRFRYLVEETPTYLLVDEQGRLRRRFAGSRTTNVLEAMLGSLEAGQAK
jgi:hypothetical protein